MKKQIAATLLLGAALMLGACAKPAATDANSTDADGKSASNAANTTTTKNNLDAAPPKNSALDVSVITPKTGSLSVNRSSSATLTALRDSQVAALSSGAVIKLLAKEGQTVKTGQVVVQLDDSALRQSLESAELQLKNAQINLAQTQRNTQQGDPQLKAALNAAQANYDKAKQDVASNRQLFSLGGISAADLKSSEATLAQTQSGLAQAQNNLTQNGQSGAGSLALLQNQVQSAEVSVKQAQENLAKSSVRAPFDGTLAKISAKLGEYVNTGTAVFRLVDTSSLSADFSVSPADAAALTAGTKMNFDYGGKTYLATVKAGDRLAGNDRLVPLSTRFGNTAAQLPIGGVGQMRYRVSLAKGLLVPTGAIQNDGGGNAVYLVKAGAAVRKPVQILAESQGKVAISGVNSGEQIVYPVPPSLQGGASVKVSSATGTSGKAGE